MQHSNNYPFTYFKRKIKQREGGTQSTKRKHRETLQAPQQLLITHFNTINNVGFPISHETMERFLPDRLDEDNFLEIKSMKYLICNSREEQSIFRDIPIPNKSYGCKIKSDRLHTPGTNRPLLKEELHSPSSLHAGSSPYTNVITRHYSAVSSLFLNITPASGGERKRSRSKGALTPNNTQKLEHLGSPRAMRRPGTALLSPLRHTAQRGARMTTRLMMGLLLLFPALATAVGQRHSGITYNDGE